MDELRELYQQVILDHNKDPRNYGKPTKCSHSSEGYNPLCGDKVNVYVDVADGMISDVHFEGSGCAISKASASVMTTVLKGKPVAEAKAIFQNFQNMITADINTEIDLASLGKMAVFAGVREFPSRVKCAGLAWHTVAAALEDNSETVSTE